MRKTIKLIADASGVYHLPIADEPKRKARPRQPQFNMQAYFEEWKPPLSPSEYQSYWTLHKVERHNMTGEPIGLYDKVTDEPHHQRRTVQTFVYAFRHGRMVEIKRFPARHYKWGW